MKRRIFLLLTTGFLARWVCAEPQQYSIQPNVASRFELHVFKTGLYRGKVHTFLFPSYTGTVIYDTQRPEASKIELTFAANAMKCVDAWLNSKDLKWLENAGGRNVEESCRFILGDLGRGRTGARDGCDRLGHQSASDLRQFGSYG